MSEHTDVLIIGGGPAGSTVATLLADAGWKVTIMERATFPRDHIGEALIPSAVPMLERLGVKAALDARGYLRKRGTTFIWGADRDPWTVYFHEGRPSANYSYQVWRPDFDELLLANCESHGVTVKRERAVTEVIERGGRVCGAVSVGRGNEQRTEAGLVIDASGQSGVLSRAFGLRVWDPELRNTAVYGYFTGADTLPGIDATNTLVEGYEDGWFWTIPLHVGLTSVGTVVSSDHYQELRSGTLADTYMRQIAKTRRTAQLLSNASFARGPFVARDWSFHATRLWGPGWLLLGDAACFIDPLFSTGVYLAMQQAALAAACITSMLNGDIAEDEALAFYEKEYLAEYNDLRTICLLMYSGVRLPMDSVFWKARAIQSLPNSLEARRAFVRLISGRERRGFEVSPLTRLDLSADWRHSLNDFERSLRARLPVLGDEGDDSTSRRLLRETADIDDGHEFNDCVLVRDSGVQIENSLIARHERLVRGVVIRTPLNPRGLPASRRVADTLLPLVDGVRSVREVVREALSINRQDNEVTCKAATLELADLYWYGALQVRSRNSARGETVSGCVATEQ